MPDDRQPYNVVSLAPRTTRTEFRDSKCKLKSQATGSVDAFSGHEWLDGLHRQTPMQSGFRRPTPYYGGYHFAEGIRSGIYAYRGTCPTWKNDPINLNVSQIFRYAPHLLQFPDITPSNPVISNLLNWSLTEAISKANRSEFNLGVTVGERMQTYRLVRDTILEFRHFVKDLKSGRVDKVTRRLRTTDPFKLWLQYRYGWKQLYNDIVSLLELIEGLGLQGKGDRFHVKSVVEVPFSSPGESTSTYYAKVNSTVSGTAFCKTRLDYQIANPDRFVLNQFGVDTSVVAWELVPWSFVADWFVNVGSFLEAAAYSGGLEFLGGSQTYGIKMTELSVITSGSTWSVQSGTVKALGFGFTRTPVYVATPRIAVNPYALSGQFSSTRIADAVSLAWTAVKGSFKSSK